MAKSKYHSDQQAAGLVPPERCYGGDAPVKRSSSAWYPEQCTIDLAMICTDDESVPQPIW